MNKSLNQEVFLVSYTSIRHLHISNNAPYWPPEIVYNLCFSFLMGITAVPTEIESNAYAGDVQVVNKMRLLALIGPFTDRQIDRFPYPFSMYSRYTSTNEIPTLSLT